ncbi:hypothetical protein MmiHf6_02850 [Methanimicrococcus hongohii]|uniref:Proteinase inhibitor I42 chagasin domain-containing protein n=1 Tax=Methanimicrococcus hongohii TaxID=3028295 RepID=A0AA96UYJ5_9EURY|nr:protease inhibitor I42 family protein [Methanimicrococcus sp. Hf6]WNY22989.1 hypothetical protein MmiHf6_02850 [Methanimicrococcus sp. Hf6]
MKKAPALFLLIILCISVPFSGCLSVIEDSGLTGDKNDPYNSAPMQKMFNREHTNVQIRLREIPEQRWSVGVDSSGILKITDSAYVADEYIFNEKGYHKWVFQGVQPGVATVTFSYDYNGTTVTKHTLTVYVDEEDMSLRIYEK